MWIFSHVQVATEIKLVIVNLLNFYTLKSLCNSCANIYSHHHFFLQTEPYTLYDDDTGNLSGASLESDISGDDDDEEENSHPMIKRETDFHSQGMGKAQLELADDMFVRYLY